MKKQFTSRLARKEYKENLKKTYLYGISTILLIIGLLVFGIPALIKMAIFLGNLKSTYAPVEKENQLPPPVPRFKSTFEATNSAQISLEGYSEPESMIEVFENDISKNNILSGVDGSFIILDFTLTPGKNEIYAIATNKSNVKSLSSEKLIVDYDNTPPVITITEPQENTSIFIPDGKIQIKGEASEEVELTINDRMVILDSNHKFVYQTTLSDGQNQFKAVAIDKAGNRIEKEFSLTRE